MKAPMRKMRQQGFTLIEVMVAVIIVSIALPALLLQMGNMATQTAYSRETAVAHWVAENKLQEIKLTKQMQRQVPTGPPKPPKWIRRFSAKFCKYVSMYDCRAKKTSWPL